MCMCMCICRCMCMLLLSLFQNTKIHIKQGGHKYADTKVIKA